MEKTYSKEEVNALIQPLLDQIEFYQGQYIKCRKFIIEPWYKTVFRKWSFIKQLWKDDDESNTLIENLRKFAEQNPKEYQFLKEFYDRKSPRNN